ncbi:ATP-dependent DNA helicase Q-like SIM [Cornus florida]|uniref:ATP-dependent DNA helicase Q-like SIM n=1 Tax=Cornus florida TaxID=4283 RepID=UPI00289FA323|nr:ATP-dependent DNA helicase Q-like SIM [Cornus florida]
MSSDEVIAELIGMGFEFSDVTEAIEAVGPKLNDAVEFILNGSHRKSKHASSSFKCSTSNKKALGRKTMSSPGSLRQLSIMEHLKPAARPKRSRTSVKPDVLVSGSEVSPKFVEGPNETLPVLDSNRKPTAQMPMLPSYWNKELDIGPDWEQKVNGLLHKHFGYSSLKSFQKEALAAWLAHQDCLVLAATGSGKSLCFQIPALLTGKVVVVVSPLISLMHDQCLKLAKHGVSACFLGSGQTDSSVEQKAMRGMYGIIYVCPETILRLIKPLQSLAESRGIALFAIDEVHCVSKWGHDFRPDYRRMSVLRESFRADNLKFLKFDIPLMALTATATVNVRGDILKSLCMSKETKIVLTSFFRPNLRFSVKHSRTSSPSSYEKDFCELIDVYTRKEKSYKKKQNMISQDQGDASDNSTSNLYGSIYEADHGDSIENDPSFGSDDEVSFRKGSCSTSSKEKEMSVEYLEDECDLFQGVDDLDVPCGEFCGQLPAKDWNFCGSSENNDLLNIPEERLKLLQVPLGQGCTIIYVPTRKETLNIAKFLCRFGVKAAAYNAKLPKSHLRQVHKEFHENALQIVVATIAFGMGIDKLNVRRIIHYGWPQSLEAYYQEAGRAGRDGKLADCVLYANISRTPTLLPSKRSEDQTKQAYKMLSDCYRYGMATSSCRAKILVEYFGEQFSYEKCLLCDICVNGPPEKQNLKAEVDIFMQVVATHYAQSSFADGSNDILTRNGNKRERFMEKPNIRMFVSKIREQFLKFSASDFLWWRGLARILEDKGFIREGDDMTRVQIKFPEPTELGLELLSCREEQSFDVYPEADMLLSMRTPKSFSTFSEWGKGWADPEIRRQRLERRRSGRNPRKRKSRKQNPDIRTVRGRLAAKLSKQS